MSNFTTPLELTPMGYKWKTTRDMIYHIGSKNSLMRVVVPEGYITDLASVPRLLWPILPPFGPYSAAAVVHDYLYNDHHVIDRGSLCPITRKQADDIFHEAMLVLKVPRWKALIMYLAVRAFGRKGWDQ